MALNSKQRAYLRGQAQHLDTIFQVGKDGVTEATAEAIRTALEARELIKCRVLDTCPYKAKEAAEILCEYIGCDSVQVIGSKFVLFMQKKKDSQYEI
ncbi:MAG: YhbY family RNA-binding protein [Oscillospiraceae bacterium]|nr:YhbY family RNA-binding protein [Oscillospiraceae bacterium]MBR5251331.1 YhbY family RNA-binding protein [Oscillospiraceae bacterium]